MSPPSTSLPAVADALLPMPLDSSDSEAAGGDQPPATLLSAGAGLRIAGALALTVPLWLAVGWALGWFS